MIRVFLVFVLVPVYLGQDIVFPNVPKKPPKNTSKIEEPSCPPNMAFVAAENSCECLRGFLYYPPTDSCFTPFKRGPCPPGHYLALPKDAEIAECIRNACGNNGTVPFRNTCSSLLTSGPPCPENETLIPDEETFELVCQPVIPVVYQIIVAPVTECMRGSKRIAGGQCRRLL